MLRLLDTAIVLSGAAFLAATSLAKIIRMWRRGSLEDLDNRLSVLPEPLRRWMLGELSTAGLLRAAIAWLRQSHLITS